MGTDYCGGGAEGKPTGEGVKRRAVRASGEERECEGQNDQSCPLLASLMNASRVTTRTRAAWIRCSESWPEVK